MQIPTLVDLDVCSNWFTCLHGLHKLRHVNLVQFVYVFTRFTPHYTHDLESQIGLQVYLVYPISVYILNGKNTFTCLPGLLPHYVVLS